MRWSWLPNALSIARILLVPPSVLALLSGHYAITLVCFGCAAVSDGLDGWLAKSFGWTSRFGKIIDPIADKLLLVSLFVVLSVVHLVPRWLTIAVVMRDIVIVIGAALYRAVIGYLEGRPTTVSKLNTVLQLIFVLTVIATAQWAYPSESVQRWLGAMVFVTTVISGIDYVLTYARAAVHARQAR